MADFNQIRNVLGLDDEIQPEPELIESVAPQPSLIEDPSILERQKLIEQFRAAPAPKESTGVNPGKILLNILSFSPRVGGQARQILDGMEGRQAAKTNQYFKNMEMADRMEQLNIQARGENREQDKWALEKRKMEQEEKTAAERKDPNSIESRTAQSLATQYSPGNAAHFKTMSAEQIYKALPFMQDAFKTQIDMMKANMEAAKTAKNLFTPGEEAEDKAFGAKMVEQQDQYGKFREDIKEAKAITDALRADNAPKNPVSQFIPNAYGMGEAVKKNVNPEYYALQERAKNLIRRNMRGSGLLAAGAASDRDIENAMATIWDPNFSNEENAKRIEQFMTRTGITQGKNQERIKHYKTHGTLKGFDESAPAVDQTPVFKSARDMPIGSIGVVNGKKVKRTGENAVIEVQ